jgi:hypothetical protein
VGKASAFPWYHASAHISLPSSYSCDCACCAYLQGLADSASIRKEIDAYVTAMFPEQELK